MVCLPFLRAIINTRQYHSHSLTAVVGADLIVITVGVLFFVSWNDLAVVMMSFFVNELYLILTCFRRP